MGMSQEWLLARWRIGDERPDMPITRRHEARRHVLAEQCDTLGVQAVTDRQGTAGVIAVGRIGKRGVGAKADTREINAARRPTSRVRRGLSADSRILGERTSPAVLRQHPRCPDIISQQIKCDLVGSVADRERAGRILDHGAAMSIRRHGEVRGLVVSGDMEGLKHRAATAHILHHHRF
jgi:hypothetical protein